MSVCSPRTIQGGPKDIKKESINSPRKFKFVRGPSWVHQNTSKRCPYVVHRQKFFRRQSWVHHQGVPMGHAFVRIGEDFVCVGPYFVRGPSGFLQKTSERCPYVVCRQDLVRIPSWVHHKDVRMGPGFVRIGQDFVRVGQHFVRGPSGVLQKALKRCPYLVRGQDLVRRPSWVHHKDVLWDKALSV